MFLVNKWLPGKIFIGFPDPKGKILNYKINGIWIYLLTIILLTIGRFVFKISLIFIIE